MYKQVFYIGGWPAIHFLILLISVAKCQNSILRNCCYHIVNVAGQFLNHGELYFEKWEMWYCNNSLFEKLKIKPLKCACVHYSAAQEIFVTALPNHNGWLQVILSETLGNALFFMPLFFFEASLVLWCLSPSLMPPYIFNASLLRCLFTSLMALFFINASFLWCFFTFDVSFPLWSLYSSLMPLLFFNASFLL